MEDRTMTSDMVQVWITVTDVDGSSRLESRWHSASTAAATVPATPATATATAAAA